MKKSVAQLKRDADSGKMWMELVERYGESGDKIIERLRGNRKVLRSNSVCLVLENLSGQESELRLPCAKLIEYDGENLTIYEAGERDLTEEEKNCLKAWQQKEIIYYKKNPYGDSYWHRRFFFEDSKFPYLNGTEKVRGKKYNYNGKIWDDSIKGDIILRYKVSFE